MRDTATRSEPPHRVTATLEVPIPFTTRPHSSPLVIAAHLGLRPVPSRVILPLAPSHRTASWPHSKCTFPYACEAQNFADQNPAHEALNLTRLSGGGAHYRPTLDASQSASAERSTNLLMDHPRVISTTSTDLKLNGASGAGQHLWLSLSHHDPRALTAALLQLDRGRPAPSVA
jgi:hypothetical protein